MQKQSYFTKRHTYEMAAGSAGNDRLSLMAASGGTALAASSQVATERTMYAPALDIPLEPSEPGPAYYAYRRALDLVASVAGLAFFGLLLPFLAVLIKLDSRGPVFYRQDRIGLNRRRQAVGGRGGDRRKVVRPGRQFAIAKLRTMTVNAEAAGPQWAKSNDARITRVGKILRKTRLDELPQFWNVMRGDMSLIGPRPERLVFIRQLEHEVPYYHDRLLVKPGLTGLAQVRNGYDTDVDSVRRKVAYDREYIRHNGLKQDLAILAATVRVVLKGEGAH